MLRHFGGSKADAVPEPGGRQHLQLHQYLKQLPRLTELPQQAWRHHNEPRSRQPARLRSLVERLEAGPGRHPQPPSDRDAAAEGSDRRLPFLRQPEQQQEEVCSQ